MTNSSRLSVSDALGSESGEKMGLKELFAERFGQEQADAVEMAGMTHYEVDPQSRGTTQGYGSDPFRTALVFAIGFDCYRERFKEFHNITLDEREVDEWIKENVDLTKHDGAYDWVSALAGAYEPFVSKES